MEGKDTNLKEAVRFSKVRRRLFPDDNDDEINGERLNGERENKLNIIFEEARQKREDAKKKWNFDFEKEVPLTPGRYEWIKLDRDGNEVSDSVKPNNGVQILQGELAEETSKSTKETEKTEENDDRTDETA